MSITRSRLLEAVRQDAAIRSITRLQPIGGEGDKVFPPTYATDDKASTRYALEQRRVNGVSVDTVILDSVASQANRMEEALLQAYQEGEIDIPVYEVDFSQAGLSDVPNVTTLDAPHRIADAIFRDSKLDETSFRETSVGQCFVNASPKKAYGMFQVCPTALTFGVWDSSGDKGGSGYKFPRAIVSEVVAYGVDQGVKSESRLDPLNIRAGAKIYLDSKAPKTEWRMATTDKEKGSANPSKIVHGNIAPTLDTKAGGVTFDYAEQRWYLSLVTLRQLRFPEAPAEARAVLAALSLCAAVFVRRDGFQLRSRAQLIPSPPQAQTFEIVNSDGEVSESFSLSREEASSLFAEVLKYANDKGIAWLEGERKFTPSDKFVALIKKSQEISQSDDEG